MAFSGTQQKCKACDKTVYLVEQLTADGVVYHKSCFRCNHCKGTLKWIEEAFEHVRHQQVLGCLSKIGVYVLTQDGNRCPPKLSNYASLEGVLYCKPHFVQLLKLTGSFEKSFEHKSSEGVKKASEKQENKAPSKASLMFSGTQEKCIACSKTVYPIEKTTVEGLPYHKNCFKCVHGGCTISPSNYAALEGRLYCKHHYAQLFKEKGNYSQLTKAPALKLAAGSTAGES